MFLSRIFFPLQLIFFKLITPDKILAQTTVRETEEGYASLLELETIFSNILNVITVLAGFAVLLMLTIGAFKYIVAQGDPKAVSAARSTITWAIAGLVFMIVAWLVILFVESVSGVNLTRFTIELPE